VPECDLFLSLTSDANTNLVAASLARALGARKAIARVHLGVQQEEWLFDFKSQFGIDYLFSSERLAAVELAKYVRNPEGLMVEELARGRIELQQIRIPPDSPVAGRTLQELGLPNRLRVASIQRGELHFIPGAGDPIRADDLVTVFGEPRKLSELAKTWRNAESEEGEKTVVIFGGGDYGFSLAQMLEGGRFRVRIMERDPRVCRRISNLLQRTVVLQGDATSLQFLKEERVGDADFYIAATRDDEDNVMTCLQAKNLGTKYCVALIHRSDYADVISQNSERLRILGAVSPRVATSRDLLRFVTSKDYHVVMELSGGVQVIETPIKRNSAVAGQRIADVAWPPGSGLVALLQGSKAVVPAGSDVMEPGDTAYAIVSPEARGALIKLLRER
jgi:trk system potassium uptake protein TrkA